MSEDWYDELKESDLEVRILKSRLEERDSEIASLKSQLAEALKDREKLIQTLKFYADTKGLLPFVKVLQSDPLTNPDGPPDAYGLSDKLCIPAREAIAAMEAENGRA